ncbi:hypothetical protein AB0J74_04510 [Asanoa sp. NPDC049573]|uniref:hypothetical protein n=1 Tax=Asanoa sp. NPDC049573 TaxID=3155396 RepID=UPI00344A9DE2
MRKRVLAVASTAVLIGLAGCGQASDSAAGGTPAVSATTAAPADPVARLKASTKEIEAGNYRFEFKGGPLSGKGYVHKPTKGTKLDMNYDDPNFKISAELWVVDTATMVRLTRGGQPVGGGGKWMKLDLAKAKDSELLEYIAPVDVPGAAQVLATATDVVEKDGALTGMVDLAKPQGVPTIDENLLDQISRSVNRVPFSATLDDQGRLAKLVLDLVGPSAGHLSTLDFTYTDYGTVTPEAAPGATEAVDAPADFYDEL